MKTIYLVSYPFKVNVNGVTCVTVCFVVHFSSSDTLKKVTDLRIHIYISTKTCMTDNNLGLHKTLPGCHIQYSGPSEF